MSAPIWEPFYAEACRWRGCMSDITQEWWCDLHGQRVDRDVRTL
jgi:hypothetical protein